MPDPTRAARKRRWRERRKDANWPPPPCAACGRTHNGVHSKLLCSRCWQSLTDDGRADRAARVAKAKARSRSA